MSVEDLSVVYSGKQLPPITDDILNEASTLAAQTNCTVEDALLYILDMMIERPFGD